MSDSRIVMAVIIVIFVGFFVGRKFQNMRDLWNKWQGTLAALPGMERDFKKGRKTFIIFIGIALVAIRIVTYIDFK